jgi:heat shock protein HslJ
LLVQYGKVVGFAGCNRYTGSLKETSPGTIELGPLALTRMACPPPASELEERFVARMNKVKGYTFVAGRLGLTWSDKDTQGMLVFSK